MELEPVFGAGTRLAFSKTAQAATESNRYGHEPVDHGTGQPIESVDFDATQNE